MRRRLYSTAERISPEYNSWRGMIERCRSSNWEKFSCYAKRGIKVCKEWEEDYFAFLRDMGRKPTPFHSLDRINVDGDYEPKNCRWANTKEQGRNRRTSVMIEIDGVSKCLSAWSEESGVNYQTIVGRLKYGWEPKRAVFTPPTINHRFLTIDGETKSLTEWSRQYGVDYTTIIVRIKRGWTEEDAVKIPSGTSYMVKNPSFVIEISVNKIKDLLDGKIESFRFVDSSNTEWMVVLGPNGKIGLVKEQ